MQQDTFYKTLQHIYANGHFLRFDEFIIGKLCDISLDEGITDDLRREAYGKFQILTGRAALASDVTMRRWFGMSGYAKPNRVHIYEMAFALHLNKEETEEYLTRGIGEPSFQISDYHEIIYLYGIENGFSFEKCQQMVHLFEKNLMVNQRLSTTRSTEQLRQQYEEKKNLPVSEFLLFMTDNAVYFKGYSNTALKYLLSYRNQVLKYIREDAAEQLDQQLAETDYQAWRRRQWILQKQDPYRMLQKYLKSRSGRALSEELIKNIKELAKIAYSTLSNNSLVRSELFCARPERHPKAGSSKNGDCKTADARTMYSDVRNMTMKHISDLFNIANQKEYAMKVIAALGQLETLQEEDACPSDVRDLLQRLMKKDDLDWNCGRAREWLLEYDKEHKRRQLLVQRSDLLPFVLYVSQQEYEKQMEETGAWYDESKAREMFRQAADGVLNACNMAPLSEERELDAVLLACYQDEEMYGYAEVLERLPG